MSKALLCIAMAFAGSLAAAEFSGKWTGTMETNGNRVKIFVTLSQHDQDLSGTVATADETRAVPIEKPEIHGDEVTFDVRDNAGRIVKFRLSRSGLAMNGDANASGQVSRIALSTEAKAADGRGGGDRQSMPTIPLPEGAHRVGAGVSAPVVILKTNPDYTEQARAAKYQGTVLLGIAVDPQGNATNIRVIRSLGLGLDEKAIEAVKKWKFKPGLKDGVPVTVAATIEINFRL